MRRPWLLSLLVALGLSFTPRPALAATFDVTAYGACSGCAAATNRAGFAAAIAAASPGDVLFIPAGTFTVNKDGGSPWSIRINKTLTVRGVDWDTSVVAMDPVDALDADPPGNAVALFYVDADDVVFEDLRLEGNKPNPNGPTEYNPLLEHHRAIFVNVDADGGTYQRLKIRNFTGDGIQLYNNVDDTTITDNVIEWNQRDGVTLAPATAATPVTNVLIANNVIRGCSNQQIDNEHGPADDVEIRYNTLERAANANSIGITIAGAGWPDPPNPTVPSRRWNVHHNTILGTVRFTWTSDSVIADNVIVNDRGASAIELERIQDNNQILRNSITQTQTSTAQLAAVYLNGTTGGGASNIVVNDNKITVTGHTQSFGIRADGAVSLSANGNTVVGPGVAVAGYFGVRVRTSVPSRPVESVTITNNQFRGWGEGGVGFFGGSATTEGRLLSATVTGNWCEHGGSMTECMDLDDGLGPAEVVVLGKNVQGCGVTTLVADLVPTIALSGSPLNMRVACP